MKMSMREQEMLLNRVAWGGCYACVENSEGEQIYLVIKELTLKDKSWSDFIYQQAILNGKERELMSESELAVILSERELWTKADDHKMKELQSGIKKIDEELVDETKTRHEINKLNRTKKLLKIQLDKLSGRHAMLLSGCLENFAAQQKVRAMAFCSTYTMEDGRYWPTWEHFLNESDEKLIKGILEKMSELRNVSTREFRFLARSNHWRFKWAASKNCDDLFGKPVVELTRSQEALVYWSQIYDSVYESMDRPSEEVINDDELLDEWFKEQSKKRKVKEVESGKSNKLRISNKQGRHGEIGIVTNAALIQDMERAAKLGIAKHKEVPTPQEIDGLNSELSKKFLSVQRERLKKHKTVREEDLRSDSDSRRVINSTDAVVEKYRRPDGFTGKRASKKFDGGTLRGRRE